MLGECYFLFFLQSDLVCRLVYNKLLGSTWLIQSNKTVSFMITHIKEVYTQHLQTDRSMSTLSLKCLWSSVFQIVCSLQQQHCALNNSVCKTFM